MKQIFKFKLLAGSHTDNASGNTYQCTPDKTVPPKPDAEDQNPTVIPGAQPVFESACALDKIFRNKFMRVPDDTPVTGKPDGSALSAMAWNATKAKQKAAPPAAAGGSRKN